jgi:hypothetical protein
MGSMPKKNEIRDSVNWHPSNAFVFFGCRAQLRDLRAVLLNLLMAGHAEIGRREFGFVARVYSGVANLAGHLQLTGVSLVTESKRLRGDRLREHFFVIGRLSLFLRPSSMHEAEKQ